MSFNISTELGSIRVRIKTSSRFECEILGYSIYIYHHKEMKYVMLTVSNHGDVVLAQSGDFESIKDALSFAVSKSFGNPV